MARTVTQIGSPHKAIAPVERDLVNRFGRGACG
jgi:hypothetical protein